MENLVLGERLIDRWAAFYVYVHNGSRFAIAFEVLYGLLMNDEEKQLDFKKRLDFGKDAYAFETEKAAFLLDRARKKDEKSLSRMRKAGENLAAFRGVMTEVVTRSFIHHKEEEEGVTFITEAQVVMTQGTSVMMQLYAVSEQGIDCWQWFSKENFEKRFRRK